MYVRMCISYWKVLDMWAMTLPGHQKYSQMQYQLFFVWFYESNGHYIINGINSEFIFANGFTELAHSHPNISVCTLYIRVQTYVSDRLEVMFLY